MEDGMPIIVPGLVACALLGVLLAQAWLPLGGGFLGAILMLAAASRLRAHWRRHPSAPDLAERGAILSSGSTLVCLGFFLAKLYQIGPDLDIHSRMARAMASELWTLIGASLVAQWIARAPAARRDERDAGIASSALGASCYVLLAMQLALLLWFSFATGEGMPALSSGMLAHLLIGSWMLTHVFYDLACLRAYAGMRSFAAGAP
jgi:hypothetical protein